MNPETLSTTQPTLVTKKNHTALKTLGVILLTLVILGLASYSAHTWMQNTELRNNISKKDADNKALAAQVESLQNTPAKTNATITTLLPNGKTATYPDTDGNRNMLFWSAGSDQSTTGFVLLSHKSIQEFLSSVNADIITNICGTDDSLKALKYNISVGILNTSTKALSHPQNGDCVDALATSDKSGAELKAKAQTIIDNVNKDLKEFISSVKIS